MKEPTERGMFDLSWSELLLVGAVALVVIGPRELPRVLRTVGQSLAKLRRMAADFQSQFSAAMREAEFDEIRKAVDDVKTATGRAVGGAPLAGFNPLHTVRNELRDAIVNETPAAVAPTPRVVDPAIASPLPLADSLSPVISASFAPEGARRKRARVIVAAPRDVVKPLASPARRKSRLYKKVRFSAMPARPRRLREEEL